MPYAPTTNPSSLFVWFVRVDELVLLIISALSYAYLPTCGFRS